MIVILVIKNSIIHYYIIDVYVGMRFYFNQVFYRP